MAPRIGRWGVAATAFTGIVVGGALAAPAISVSAHSTGQAKLPTAPSGFEVSVFASATTAFSNPDSIEVAGDDVFVGYQNLTAKDGSDGRSSTIAEYSLSGKLRRTFPALGHVDGLRVDPATGLVWALANEDANPKLTIIDPASGGSKLYSLTSVNHGGGFDDIAFVGGKVYMSASNPTKVAPNTDPAVVRVTISGNTVTTTPVLRGNATATDVVSHTSVTLNLTDPDSLYVLPNGDLQLDSQADQKLVFIHNPGPRQTVSVLGIGNAMDDTILPTSASGRLLVADTGAGVIYSVTSKHFDTGMYLSAAPSDSPVSGYVGLIDPATGANHPFVTGMTSPHGEAFIPTSKG